VVAGHITAAVDGLSRARLSSLGFRHQAVEWQYSQPGAGARTIGGRWNPPNSFATLYLGLSIEVVAAEFRRLAERAGRDPADFMPRHLLQYEIELRAVLDLTDEAAMAAVGLTEAQLRSSNSEACQRVGEAAHHLGREGVLAPSATGEGLVLAVFVERLLPTSRLDIVSTTVWRTPP
jgi:RES domain-containing protein